jgi:cell division protein FtsW
MPNISKKKRTLGRISSRRNKYDMEHVVHRDNLLLLTLCSLVVLGLVMVNSASAVAGFLKFSDPFYFSKKQIFSLLVGTVCMWGAYRLELRLWNKIAPALVALSCLLLFVVLIPGIGVTVNG